MSYEERSESVVRRISLWCFLMTAAVSLLALIGWASGSVLITGISDLYVPIAPSTAVSLLILSVSFLVYLLHSESFTGQMVSAVCASLTLTICVIILLGFVLEITFEAERLGFREVLSLSSFPSGHMSPITASNLIVASLGALVLVFHPKGKQLYKNVAALLGVGVTIASFIMLLGYAYGTPLLYGGQLIPVALPTAVALEFLSLGLITASGPHALPVRVFIGPAVRSRLMRVFLPPVFALTLIHGLVLYKAALYMRTNPALVSSIITIVATVMIGVIISIFAKSVGEEIDQAHQDRDEKEIELRQWAHVFEHAGWGIVTGSADGKSLGLMNPAYARMHGYTVEELTGKFIRDIFAPESLAEFPEHLRLARAKGHHTYESKHIRKDGTVFPVVVDVTVVREETDQVSFRVVNIQDISERRLLEERLRRGEKMQALGTLAGGVAHDLNNVLGVLVGYSELLLEKIPEEHSHRKYVSHILAASEKGAAIVQDLLTLARRGMSVSQVMNLNRVVSDFMKAPVFERLRADRPTVTFRADLCEELLNIKGSPIHLEKTVMNLILNAAESISEEGEVTIRTDNCYIDKPIRAYDEVHEGEYVVLTVADNGGGIATADMNRIFEPFYTKKVMGKSGTGLGLAVVWGTVKDHRGYIDVQSRPGEGSTFKLYFPATREELAGEHPKIPIEQYMGRGESILVVDDMADQRELAASMLTRLGYRVHAVSSGEEAVNYLKTRKADLMVLDMIMDPGIDGLETYRQVLEVNPQQKAIIVSGFSETERVKRAQELGVGGYVRKPYLLAKIGLAVRDELLKGAPGSS
ncbi:MAG TPA: ATP-binding protein [bacterium]|nr:ATP-binding protein [bacterium]